MCHKTLYRVLASILFLWNTASVSSAQFTEDLALHGFGGWVYGKTDNDNQYLAGDPDGNYEHLYFSLNLTAKPYENVAIHVQSAFNETNYGNNTGIDYAFAEWIFSDALKLRAGKVIAPFMLYTEIYDVGTLRPFFFLPPGLYRELAAEAYSGAGFTGTIFTKHDWEIHYDLYGGKLDLQPQRYASLDRREFVSFTPTVHDMLGGRLFLRSPFNGLGAGVSAFRGALHFDLDELDLSDTYTAIGASAEYISFPWLLRAEYMTQPESSKIQINIAYVEAAYRFTEHWQLASRYEFVDVSIPDVEALYPKSFLEHQELVAGINYWVTPSLVLKSSYHRVSGNRFAFPVSVTDFLGQIQRGYFDEQTNLVTFGVQFSF